MNKQEKPPPSAEPHPKHTQRSSYCSSCTQSTQGWPCLSLPVPTTGWGHWGFAGGLYTGICMGICRGVFAQELALLGPLCHTTVPGGVW